MESTELRAQGSLPVVGGNSRELHGGLGGRVRDGSDCRWQLGRKSFLYGDEVQQFGGKHLIEQALMARCSEKRPHQALSGSEGDLGDD